mmetsp:Transcript_2631/g.5795  ORF Transcript_2631/g.5795 Transcript_2631/m.5795 type:complete len:230 (-) Transcript_2631:1327-2016(-)
MPRPLLPLRLCSRAAFPRGRSGPSTRASPRRRHRPGRCRGLAGGAAAPPGPPPAWAAPARLGASPCGRGSGTGSTRRRCTAPAARAPRCASRASRGPRGTAAARLAPGRGTGAAPRTTSPRASRGSGPAPFRARRSWLAPRSACSARPSARRAAAWPSGSAPSTGPAARRRTRARAKCAPSTPAAHAAAPGRFACRRRRAPRPPWPWPRCAARAPAPMPRPRAGHGAIS